MNIKKINLEQLQTLIRQRNSEQIGGYKEDEDYDRCEVIVKFEDKTWKVEFSYSSNGHGISGDEFDLIEVEPIETITTVWKIKE